MYQELLQLELYFLQFELGLCHALSAMDFLLPLNCNEEINTNIAALRALLGRADLLPEADRTRETERVLGESYRCRISYWQRIRTIPCSVVADFANQFIDLDNALDVLVKEINFYGRLRDRSKGASFVHQLSEVSRGFQQAVADYVASQEWLTVGLPQAVRWFFGDLFPRALYLQKRIIFWQSWRGYLNKAIARIQPAGAEGAVGRRSILDALAIKRRLISTKKQFFLSIYKAIGNRPETALVRNVLAARRDGIIAPCVLVERLAQSFAELQLEVTHQEQELKKCELLQDAISVGLYLWTESYYFKFAESYFTLLNDLAEDSELTKVPLLRVKLTDNYLSFFTALGSVLLLEIDSRFIGMTGISCALFNTLSQFLLSDLEKIVKLSSGFLDEQEIVGCLPYVEQLLGLGFNIFLYSLIFGANLGTVGLLTTAFLAVNACRKLAGSALDWLHGSERQGDKSWELFVKQPVQHVASVAAYYFAGKVSLRFFPFPISEEQLLADKELCLQEAQRCKKTALKVLGLTEGATLKEIKYAFRQSALKYHSDKTREMSSDVQMRRFYQAKEQLKNLGVFDDGSDGAGNTIYPLALRSHLEYPSDRVYETSSDPRMMHLFQLREQLKSLGVFNDGDDGAEKYSIT